MCKGVGNTGYKVVQVVSLAAFPSSTAIQSRALLVYINTLWPGLFGFRRVHSLFDVGGKAKERIFDVDIVFSGDLQERYAKLISKPLTLFSWHGSFFFPVALIPDEDLMHALACMLLNIWEPGPNVFKREKAVSITRWFHNKQGESLLWNERSSVTS